MELAKVPCWLNTGRWLNVVAAAKSGAEQVPHVIKDKSMGSKILLAKIFAKPTGGSAIAVLATPAKSPAPPSWTSPSGVQSAMSYTIKL